MRNNRWINFVPYLIVILALFSLMNMNTGTATQNLTYNEFQKLVEEQKVTESAVTVGDNVIKIKGVFEQDGKKVGFTASVPRSETEVDALMSALEAADVKVSDMNESNLFLDTILSLIPFVIFGAMAFFLISKMNGGGNNKAFEFSKSRARLEGNIKVRFDDVAGCDEEKQEMAEIIDYLKSPKKFAKMGARIPKGILMVGSPGTGKTLLAKAVAGEADVPFYSISGSDFVEMFVGVGASRVRDMFKKAQQTAPCMIFIDEIDAVGRQRGAGLGGGHDEREQTLNQLLVEMDGITDNAGIVVIAATNRPDVLDPALLRPGRFDRQITVSLPDRRGRKAILEVHARNKKLAPEIDLDALAKRTPGFSGADLENVLNEAAILAVRENSDLIHMHNLDEAIDRVMMGPAKKSRKYDEKSKKLVAYHESGHAPKEEKIMNTKNDLMSAITGYMGGRVAEEVFFDDITTGAVNDIEQATKMARDMVTLYGMSDLGPVQYDHGQQNVFLGRDYNSSSNVSGQVQFEIDQEIRKIIDQCHDEAKKIILEHKEELIKIAEALIENETLTAEQIDKIIKGEPFLDLPTPEMKAAAASAAEPESPVTVETEETSQPETETE